MMVYSLFLWVFFGWYFGISSVILSGWMVQSYSEVHFLLKVVGGEVRVLRTILHDVLVRGKCGVKIICTVSDRSGCPAQDGSANQSSSF